MATPSVMPLRTMFRTPDRRRSWRAGEQALGRDRLQTCSHRKPPRDARDTAAFDRQPLHQLTTPLPAEISVKDAGPNAMVFRQVGHSNSMWFVSLFRLSTVSGAEPSIFNLNVASVRPGGNETLYLLPRQPSPRMLTECGALNDLYESELDGAASRGRPLPVGLTPPEP